MRADAFYINKGVSAKSWKQKSGKRADKKVEEAKKRLAKPGFDPGTFGLWAQHASTAPLRFVDCSNARAKSGRQNERMRLKQAVETITTQYKE